MDLADLNAAPPDEAKRHFLECCASGSWAEAMVQARPFPDTSTLMAVAEHVWGDLSEGDWLEAFAAHPRIGERPAGDDRFSRWSRTEQAGVSDEGIADALIMANRAYEARFGRVFIVFATGKAADQIIDECHARLDNDPESELRIAAAEQAKITALRLRRLLAIG